MIHLLSIKKTNFNTKTCFPAPAYDYQFQSIFPVAKTNLPSSVFCQSATLPKKFNRKSHYSMDSLLTLHGLPPPPIAPLERLPTPELDTLLPPPAGFYTLPRLRRSVSGTPLTPTGQTKEPTPRCVRFLQDTPHSQSVSNIEQIRRSNSHVESIVWWRLYNGWCVWEIVFHRGG